MRKNIINELICTDCGSGFNVTYENPLIRSENSIEYGVVSCKCGDYPVIDGILVTRKYDRLPRVISRIRSAKTKHQLWKVALLLIDEPYVRFLIRLSLFVRRVSGKWPWLSFYKLVTFIKNSRYSTYLKYRFSCPSFISAIAFLPLFKKALSDGGLLLDLGSGVGHFDFLLTRYFGEEKVVCAEKHFMNLYLAKNYIVGSGASFIVLDADLQIPFRDKMFSAILSMDAFHYIDKKQMLADEFNRALKEKGALFLLHLHNRLMENVAKGLPASPEEYAGIFRGFRSRMFPERGLVASVFSRKGVNTREDLPIDEVNRSDSISIVLARDGSFFNCDCGLKTFESSFADKKLKGATILNPLYMKVGGDYVLRFPSDYYEEEYYLIKEFFPKKVSVNAGIEALKKDFIMIPAPENFMKKNERIHRFKLWR